MSFILILHVMSFYMSFTRVLHQFYVSRVLQQCYMSYTTMLHQFYVSRVLQQCYMSYTTMLHEFYNKVTLVLHD